MIVHGRMLAKFLPVCRSNKQLKEKGSGENEQMSLHVFTSLMALSLESDVHVTGESAGRRLMKEECTLRSSEGRIET